MAGPRQYKAIVRLVSGLMLETSDEWDVARRYMSRESLAHVTDTHSQANRSGVLISLGSLTAGTPPPRQGT